MDSAAWIDVMDGPDEDIYFDADELPFRIRRRPPVIHIAIAKRWDRILLDIPLPFELFETGIERGEIGSERASRKASRYIPAPSIVFEMGKKPFEVVAINLKKITV